MSSIPLSLLLKQSERIAAIAGRPGLLVLDRDMGQVLEGLPDTDASDVHKALHLLVRQERLRRLRTGLYAIPQPGGIYRVNMLDAIDAVTKRPYLITAGRALEEHDLTGQHFTRILVLVAATQRNWTWKSDHVRYVTRPQKSLWGSGRHRGRSRVARPDRALLDAFSARAGVDLSTAVRALDTYLQRDLGLERLARSTSRMQHPSTARRIGYLIERLAGRDAAAPWQPLLGAGKALVPLLAGGSGEGAPDRRWGVLVNVPLDSLLADTHAST